MFVRRFNLDYLWQAVVPLLSGIGIGSLINEYLRRRLDREKQKADRQRWYAEFFIKPRLEALRNLHSTFVRCHFALNAHAGLNVPSTMTVHDFEQEVKAKEKEYFDALTLADIYLETGDRAAMYKALGAVRQVVTSIEYRLPGANSPKAYAEQFKAVEWQEFADTYEAALAGLRNLLNPLKALDALKDV